MLLVYPASDEIGDASAAVRNRNKKMRISIFVDERADVGGL
jgi:hypothetical protein